MFKVGDEVVVSDTYNQHLKRGERATVVVFESTHGGEVVGIAFHNKIGVHTCQGTCEEGHGWWVASTHLKLITPDEWKDCDGNTLDDIQLVHKKETCNCAYNKPNKENSKMNKSISKVLKKNTMEEGELVNKWFGDEIAENFTGQLILEDYKELYLAEANRREEEANKD